MTDNKKILIIGFVWPEPNSSAAGSRMMQLIAIFQQYNWHITFASTAQNFEHSVNLVELNISTELLKLNSETFDVFISELCPDFVLFDRFMVEEQFGWRVARTCPNAMRILDCEDLHCLRYARQAALATLSIFKETDLLTEPSTLRELASIFRCDLSLIISEHEIQLLQRLFKVNEDLLYYIPLFARVEDSMPTFIDRKDYIFIGNFLHLPNTDAVKFLKDEIWPIIRALQPHVNLQIYGAYTPQKILQLHNPKEGFYINGRAAIASAVVKSARVALAPIRFGAGMKGKLLEAMFCGTPSITTAIGAEGMTSELLWNGIIADTAEDIARAAVQLYTDEKLWLKSQRIGFKIIEDRHKLADYSAGFMARIFTVQSNLTSHRQKNFTGAMLLHHTMRSTEYLSKWISEKNKA